MKIYLSGYTKRNTFGLDLTPGGDGSVFSPISAEFPSLVVRGKDIVLVIPRESFSNSETELSVNGVNYIFSPEQTSMTLNVGDVVRMWDGKFGFDLTFTILP